MSTSTGDNEKPYTVAIVAMGPSHRDYLDECIAGTGRKSVADETWCINAMAGIIEHDRAFIMDALPYFEKASRDENPGLKGYATWLKAHPGPIYTQKVYPKFPGSVAYPLEDVLNTVGYAYANTTVAYAVMFAIHLGVKTLKLYGMDFTTMDNRAFAEAGRACVEYWLAVACARGIRVVISKSCSLCDQSMGRRLYGYSTPPAITQVDGKWKVEI